MNWTYFDERTPDDGQLIITANLKGAKQFWLWQASHDIETMRILEMDFWCPVPDLPKSPKPPASFEEYWQTISVTGSLKGECKKAWDAAMKVKK